MQLYLFLFFHWIYWYLPPTMIYDIPLVLHHAYHLQIQYTILMETN